MPVVHCKKKDYDVYIGRPSRWGNPYSHRPGTAAEYLVDSREEAVDSYRSWLYHQIRQGRVALTELSELHGKTLGCWCAPKPCHGDVLLRAASWAREMLDVELGQ